MHQNKWPSEFTKLQDVGGQSRMGFCRNEERNPLLVLVSWTPKLHFLHTEAHKDARETVSLAFSVNLYQQGSSSVQEARPRETVSHLSMAHHLCPARTLLKDTPSISLSLPGHCTRTHTYTHARTLPLQFLSSFVKS